MGVCLHHQQNKRALVGLVNKERPERSTRTRVLLLPLSTDESPSPHLHDLCGRNLRAHSGRPRLASPPAALSVTSTSLVGCTTSESAHSAVGEQILPPEALIRAMRVGLQIQSSLFTSTSYGRSSKSGLVSHGVRSAACRPLARQMGEKPPDWPWKAPGNDPSAQVTRRSRTPVA